MALISASTRFSTAASRRAGGDLSAICPAAPRTGCRCAIAVPASSADSRPRAGEEAAGGRGHPPQSCGSAGQCRRHQGLSFRRPACQAPSAAASPGEMAGWRWDRHRHRCASPSLLELGDRAGSTVIDTRFVSPGAPPLSKPARRHAATPALPVVRTLCCGYVRAFAAAAVGDIETDGQRGVRPAPSDWHS